MKRRMLPAATALLIGAIEAQADPATVPAGRGHQVTPPRATAAPVIDGTIDEDAWRQAAVLDSFTQSRPIEGLRDSLGTQCLVMYDNANLYVAFKVFDDPRQVQAPVVPRDQVWQGDWVGVSIDGYHDKQQSFFLCSNPIGIQMDGIDQEGRDSDMAPDFLYTTKGRVTDSGYEVEMAIPFKTLRFPNHNPITFGFQAIRDIRRNGVHLYWAPVRRDINSYHSQIGTLSGIAGVRPGRNLEINPTWTGTQAGARVEEGIEYDDFDSRFGLGVKLGITSNMIADVTVSPDFSQVEADAGVVDINERFAIFFPEKRPFFLEGTDIFTSPTDLVYTRRIVDPQYGAKLTGKVDRTSIGVLHASDRFPGEPIDGIPNAINPYLDENAFFTLGRFKQDVFNNSYLGLLMGERQQSESYNRGLGGDGRLRFNDEYSFTFQGVQSWSRDRDFSGVAAQLTPEQAAEVDPELLALTGESHEGTIWYGEVARDTRPLNMGFAARGTSPEFAADMGFIQRTDFMSFSGWFRPHIWSKQGKDWFNAIHFPIYAERLYDYAGTRPIEEVISVVGEVVLPRNVWFGTESVRRFIEHNGVDFDDIYRHAVWGGTERHRGVRGGATVVWGDQVVFAETVRGRDFFVELWSDLRFSSQFDASVLVRSRTVWRDQNDSRYAQGVIPRLRLGYQFTKELSLRWITELRAERFFDVNDVETSETITLAPDVLFTYYSSPGTVFYLGYGAQHEGATTEELAPQQNRIFTKVSYLWRM